MVKLKCNNIFNGGQVLLKIAICDDDIHELSCISKLLNKYRDEKKESLKYGVFSNSIELLETIKGGMYDILLLDVIMPEINGIQAAYEIRSYDKDIKIIFLTSSPEFAVESYAVDATYYLLKPCTAEKLFPLLDKVVSDARRAEDSLHIKTAAGAMRIQFSKLEFIEVISKKLFFHLTDSSVKEISGSLANYEGRLLCREEFVKVHRSYIVNMEWIMQLGAKEFTTFSGQIIPISRLLYAQVRKAYMEHLFVEKGVD
ncbi:MAG: LytTR family DNA-binding domain-containing protein [Eubacteriales bacterium]|nr:LytTR family DNA-binding domain-containing protein [Eubacteriales bacterium]